MRILVVVEMNPLPQPRRPRRPVEPSAMQDEPVDRVPGKGIEHDGGNNRHDHRRPAYVRKPQEHRAAGGEQKVGLDRRGEEVGAPQLGERHLAEIEASPAPGVVPPQTRLLPSSPATSTVFPQTRPGPKQRGLGPSCGARLRVTPPAGPGSCRRHAGGMMPWPPTGARSSFQLIRPAQ